MRKLMTENDENEFVEMILNSAKEKSMTVTNILDAVNKAAVYMNDNATLDNEQQKATELKKVVQDESVTAKIARDLEELETKEKIFPREIQKMIFDEYMNGTRRGETLSILNETCKLLDDIQIV